MAFPVSPTDGQTYTNNGTTYVYSAGLGVWDVQGSSSQAGPVTSVASRTGAVTLTAADIGAGTFPGALIGSSTFTSVGVLSATSGTDSSSTSTGALQIQGGAGITGAAYIGGVLNVAGAATLASLTVSGATSLSGSLAVTSFTTSSTTTSGGYISGATDIRSAGQVRATGWYNTPSGSYTGLATEIGISGGQGYLLVYNRDTSSYGAFNINATSTTINNNTNLTSLGVGTSASGTSGQILATNSITAYYSDERLKNKISDIENALDKIDQLSGFLYVENPLANHLGFNNPNTQVALSAQAVQRVQPEAVALAPFDRDDNGNSKSGENYLTVQYEKLIPLIVEGIKELRREINQLKGK
jgi:hypothetical protein